jgi:hypothetical protein
MAGPAAKITLIRPLCERINFAAAPLLAGLKARNYNKSGDEPGSWGRFASDDPGPLQRQEGMT